MNKDKILTLKYRPQTLSDMVGQEHVVTILKNMYISKTIFPGLIFMGSKGIGKTSSARVLARLLNCVDPQDNEPCNVCSSCISILNETSDDVLEIDAASHGLVGDIRTLKQKLFYSSLSKYRVIILDEAHMLSKEAWNAMLKILEEPPDRVIFVFCTTEFFKIPETIVTRCLVLNFKKISNDAIKKRLQQIIEAEKIGVEDGVLDLIISKSEGSMRDAITLLFQLNVFFINGKIEQAKARDILGVIDNNVYKDTLEFILKDSFNLKDLDKLAIFNSGNFDVIEFTKGIIGFLKDVLFIKSGYRDPGFSDSYVDILRKFIYLDNKNLIRAIEFLMSSINSLKIEDVGEDLFYVKLFQLRLILIGKFADNSGKIIFVDTESKVPNSVKYLVDNLRGRIVRFGETEA